MYVLNKKIRVGDIILVDSNSKIALVIKLQAIIVTWFKALVNLITCNKTPITPNYSHVAIVVSKTQVLEAIGGSGVQISSWYRFMVDDISNLAVYRINDLEAEKLIDIMEIAIKHQAKSYNLTGTIKSVLPLSKTKENKFFCSQIVTHIYEELGIKLFDKNSAKVKPNDFTKCNKLTNVSNETISKLPPYIQKRYKKRPDMWKPLDNKHNSVSQDAIRHQKFLEEAKKVFKKRKLDIPNNIHDIVEIITRPSEDGNVYLNVDLSNELMELHNKYRILEELDEDINKAVENDLDEFLAELDELGIEIALQELIAYEDFLQSSHEKIKENTKKVVLIVQVAEKFPLNIIKTRATYSYMTLEGHKKIIKEHIKPTINALKKYIIKRDSRISL